MAVSPMHPAVIAFRSKKTLIERFPLFTIALSIITSFGIAAAQWVQTACPTGQNILCLTANGSSIFAGVNSNGIYVSSDNGSTWSSTGTGLPADVTVNAIEPVGSYLFAGTYGNGVYVTANNGSSWSAANTGLPGNATVTALQTSGSSLFAGTYGNGIYVTANNGSSWSAANTGLPGGTIVKSITLNGSNLFIGTLTGLYGSKNNGASWTQITSGLPSGITIDALASNGTNVYAGTSGNGMYNSRDNGVSWSVFDTGLQSTMSIYALTNTTADIFAGTAEGVYHCPGTSWSQVNTGLSSGYTVLSLISTVNYLYAGTSNGVWRSVMPPVPPSSFVPANNATNQGDSLALSWNSVALATSYAVQVSTDSTFSNSIIFSKSGQTSPSQVVTGLSNNTVLYWRVNASNAGGTSAWSAPCRFTTTLLSPAPISPINASTNQPVSLTMSWNAVSTAASYGIQVSTDSSFATSIVLSQSGLTSTTKTISGLSNNTVYYWRVNAANTGGTSPWSSKCAFTTIVATPEKPMLAQPANDATGQPVSATLTWNSVPSAISYVLQISTDTTFSGSIIYSQSGLTSTSQAVSGLSNNIVYYWRMNASNIAGTGPWSTINRFTTVLKAPMPVSPANDAVNQAISLTLSWEPVASAPSYSLQVAGDSTFSNSIVYSQNGLGAAAQTVSGLTNNTAYFWRVCATNAGGTSGWSASYRFTTAVAAPNAPTPVLPLNNAVNQPLSLSLTWGAIASASSYTLQLSTDSTFASSVIVNRTGLSATSGTVSGLTNNTTYYWHAAALNTAGKSPWSTTSAFTTITHTPTLLAPSNAATSQPLTVACQWRADSTATSYCLQVIASDSTFSGTVFYYRSGLTSASQTVGGLSNNSTYYWRVKTADPSGGSDWSAPYHFSTLIDAPMLVAPANNAPNQALSPKLSWNSVPTAVSYTLLVSSDSTFTTSLAYNQNAITVTSQTISGLINYTRYYWKVYALGADGSSVCSSTACFTTLLSTPATTFPANNVTDQPAKTALVWNAVAGAISYALQLATDKTFTTLIFNQGGLTSTSEPLTDLSYNTVYYWRVNATNAGGTSSWSAASSFKTSALATPVLVSPGNDTQNVPVSFEFFWDSVAAAAYYTLQVSTDSTFKTTPDCNKDSLVDTTETVSGLEKGTTYYWRVRAVNSHGKSGWSAKGVFSTVPKEEESHCGLGSILAFFPPMGFRVARRLKRRCCSPGKSSARKNLSGNA